jgi:hypothetical protein
MTLANLRGILHRGVGSWLEHLRDNPDPLRPISLFDDVGQIISEEEATANLQLILQALVENYEEFKDYNTTTAQSDYGENLFILLDFLLLKADYERSAWQLRPLAVVHNVLARKGRGEAALLWQEAFAEATQELAKNHADELAQLEREHGVRLVTISDRIREEFVKPLAVDRLCALIEPAMEEARRRAEPSAFRRLQDELQTITASPTGVGLDAPDWLRQLEVEIRRVRGAQSTIALLATEFFQVPHKLLSYDDVQRQLEDWEKPLA